MYRRLDQGASSANICIIQCERATFCQRDSSNGAVKSDWLRLTRCILASSVSCDDAELNPIKSHPAEKVRSTRLNLRKWVLDALT
jgi:hypothetical protein